MPSKRSVTKKFRFAFRRAPDSKGAASKPGILLELNIFVIGMTARRIEEEKPKSEPRPAIIAEIALKACLLDARLFVNGSHRTRRILVDFAQPRMIPLAPPLHGADERRASPPKLE